MKPKFRNLFYLFNKKNINGEERCYIFNGIKHIVFRDCCSLDINEKAIGVVRRYPKGNRIFQVCIAACNMVDVFNIKVNDHNNNGTFDLYENDEVETYYFAFCDDDEGLLSIRKKLKYVGKATKSSKIINQF